MKIFCVIYRIILPSVFLLFSGCEDDTAVTWDVGEWEFLGLEGKLVPELVLSDSFLYACAGKDGLFRLNLTGQVEWEYLGFADSTVFRELPYGVTSVYIDELSNVIFVGIATSSPNGIGLFRSEDGGLNWIPSDSGINTEQYPWSTDVQSLNSYSSPHKVILVGLTATIYRSLDGGLSWNLAWGNRDAGSLGINAIRFNIAEPNYIWAGGETGRFSAHALKSADNGETWDNLYPLPPLGPYGRDNALYDIAIDPLNVGTVYLSMLGLVIKTTDNGESWKKVLGWEYGIFRNWRIDINPNDPEELIVTGSRLYRTKDGGQSWEIIIPPEGRSELYALAINWVNRILYVSTSSPGNGIYKLKF
ncbi:MAG: hypothetical protein IID16_04930 [Candidatus Marinimicrobia bacterium]|nr:hypothetical protein [Candidatus Neomarinimicrobiota bacterium]